MKFVNIYLFQIEFVCLTIE